MSCMMLPRTYARFYMHVCTMDVSGTRLHLHPHPYLPPTDSCYCQFVQLFENQSEFRWHLDLAYENNLFLFLCTSTYIQYYYIYMSK
jgi:hypothetical protein